MLSFAGLFATDETIAREITTDYPLVTPNAWRQCQGRNGLADGFTFTDAVKDFEAIGLAPGMVICLVDGSDPNNDVLAIESVAGGTLTLRRLGMPTGTGEGPRLKPSAQAFVYEVPSCHATIAGTTAELQRRYSVTTATADLQKLCVEMVLVALYGAAHSTAGTGNGDNFRDKYRQHLAEVQRLTAFLDGQYASPRAEATASRLSPAAGRLEDDDTWGLDGSIWSR
jgi:hypothetical protein